MLLKIVLEIMIRFSFSFDLSSRMPLGIGTLISSRSAGDFPLEITTVITEYRITRPIVLPRK